MALFENPIWRSVLLLTIFLATVIAIYLVIDAASRLYASNAHWASPS